MFIKTIAHILLEKMCSVPEQQNRPPHIVLNFETIRK